MLDVEGGGGHLDLPLQRAHPGLGFRVRGLGGRVWSEVWQVEGFRGYLDLPGNPEPCGDGYAGVLWRAEGVGGHLDLPLQ